MRKAIVTAIFVAIMATGCRPAWVPTAPPPKSTSPIEHPIICFQYPQGCNDAEDS